MKLVDFINYKSIHCRCRPKHVMTKHMNVDTTDLGAYSIDHESFCTIHNAIEVNILYILVKHITTQQMKIVTHLGTYSVDCDEGERSDDNDGY